MSDKPSRVYRGRVENGRLILDPPDQDAFTRDYKAMEGKLVDLRLVRHRNQRTLSQQAFYWSVVLPLFADFCGYERDEMHDALRMQFLATHLDDKFPSVRSTTSLDTIDFSDYLAAIRRLAAKLGCDIPEPNEV